MFLNRRLDTSDPFGPGRSLVVPPPPADEPQICSPTSDYSSVYEGGKETPMALTNPWPPTPPLTTPFSSPTVNGLALSQEELTPSLSRPSRRNDNLFIRTFSLTADKTLMHFMIAVALAKDKPNHYTFSLSYKAGGVHRSICEPVTLKLTFDPQELTFNVFLFPPKHSLPNKCLYSLRVWLCHQNVDQRIFADDAFWVGTDPDFSTIPDATHATTWYQASDRQFFKCLVGRAEVHFILRWECLKEFVYSLTFEYEAGGVGKSLLENMVVRLDFPPSELSCHIYAIPLMSKPAGATHRIRLWLKSPSPFTMEEGPHPSYTYQRIWSTEEFRVGGYLDFMDIDPKKVILATPVERPPLRVRTADTILPGRTER